jgi:hypothetical protein
MKGWDDCTICRGTGEVWCDTMNKRQGFCEVTPPLSDNDSDAFSGLDASYAGKAMHWRDSCPESFKTKRSFPAYFAKLKKNVTCKRCLKAIEHAEFCNKIVNETKKALESSDEK